MLGELFRAKRPCTGLGGDAAHFGLAAMGVLHYMTPFCGVSPACRTPVSCNSPDWWHEAYISAAEPSLGWRHSPRLVAMTPRLEGCGRQSAAPLGENSQMTMVLVEWVCVLAGSVSVVVRCSYVNPLLRAVTRSIAREPAT